ncbi:hypothetical protein H696_00685 [Fonticula alba]|uniref:Uncharacterized protein n=1 Tax=Fonticula alba TaxID=691883 RepID=A0A058ZHZ0_FONAL|nr:hypothetical protein H696_00685 [Fonticula alba]KCV73137.1 hypothetical protein H696_00685 [Fonticula alba]|eukprot:XP_009492838.1 hypothetical protein H696_00685 [Fonticula alba]
MSPASPAVPRLVALAIFNSSNIPLFYAAFPQGGARVGSPAPAAGQILLGDSEVSLEYQYIFHACLDSILERAMISDRPFLGLLASFPSGKSLLSVSDFGGSGAPPAPESPSVGLPAEIHAYGFLSATRTQVVALVQAPASSSLGASSIGGAFRLRASTNTPSGTVPGAPGAPGSGNVAAPPAATAAIQLDDESMARIMAGVYSAFIAVANTHIPNDLTGYLQSLSQGQMHAFDDQPPGSLEGNQKFVAHVRRVVQPFIIT